MSRPARLAALWRSPPLRALRLLLVLGYALLLVLDSIPDEVRPAALDPGYQAAERFFDRLGVMPAHPVFGGHRGDWHRRYWALRVVGLDADGQRRVLHESPRGMVHPDVRVVYDPTEIIWYRMMGMSNVTELSTSKPGEAREKVLDRMRRHQVYSRFCEMYCRSALVEGREGLTEVRLEAFFARQSYRSGKIHAGRATIHAWRCTERMRGYRWPVPPDPPDWPLEGIVWEEESP